MKPEDRPTTEHLADAYTAKIRLWAANPRIWPLPPGPPIPKFSSQKFNSYEEMNEWKKNLILQIAAARG